MSTRAVRPQSHSFDDDEIGRLLRDYRTSGDVRLRNAVVEHCHDLALRVARAYPRTSEPFADRLQVACIGLVKAAERFDPVKGVPFEAWASLVMRGELRRHFRDRCWAMRVPRRVKDRTASVRDTFDELSARNGHTPSVADVATRLDLHVEDVREVVYAYKNFRIRSMDPERDARRDDHAQEPFDRIADDGHFSRLISTCPPRLQAVVRMRYVEQLKQSEIGVRIGVTQVQVCRLLKEAQRRIRRVVCEELNVT